MKKPDNRYMLSLITGIVGTTGLNSLHKGIFIAGDMDISAIFVTSLVTTFFLGLSLLFVLLPPPQD